MKQAIRELKMKNIDEESLSKIEEDIEQSNERIQMPLKTSSNTPLKLSMAISKAESL